MVNVVQQQRVKIQIAQQIKWNKIKYNKTAKKINKK